MADPIRVLGTFSGIGGLELAVATGLRRVGRGHRLVCVVEGETFGPACMVQAMERGELDACPVYLGDVRQFPAAEWRGAVDLVAGGFPCQDISNAGKGKGLQGERSGLFFDLERLARGVGARYLFMENVSAITVRGLDIVLGTLADFGWNAEWTHIRASDCGATHSRSRWFCLAYRADERCDAYGNAREVGTASASGAEARAQSAQAAVHQGAGNDAAVADGDYPSWHGGAFVGSVQSEPERYREGVPSWPPLPDDTDGWLRALRVRPDLCPALGLDDSDGKRVVSDGGHHPASASAGDAANAGTSGGDDHGRRNRAGVFKLRHRRPQSSLRRVVDGFSDRLDRALRFRRDRNRALGNAVVPAQGAAAFAELWIRAHGGD